MKDQATAPSVSTVRQAVEMIDYSVSNLDRTLDNLRSSFSYVIKNVPSTSLVREEVDHCGESDLGGQLIDFADKIERFRLAVEEIAQCSDV